MQYNNKEVKKNKHTTNHKRITTIHPLKTTKNQDYNTYQIKSHINQKNKIKILINTSKSLNQARPTGLAQYKVKDRHNKYIPVYLTTKTRQHINSNNTPLNQKKIQHKNIKTLQKIPYFNAYLTYILKKCDNKEVKTNKHTTNHERIATIPPLKPPKNKIIIHTK